MNPNCMTTVLGDIGRQELGYCQFHEHLLIQRGRSHEVNSDLLIDDAGKSARELERYKSAGGRTVIDAQPVGCGRDAEGLIEISRQSGVNVIASTGFHKMIFYPEGHWIFALCQEELSALFESEILEGMLSGSVGCLEGSSRGKARAGIIKCALDTGFSGQYEKLFRAASCAAARTKKSLMVHIEAGSDPVGLFRYLDKCGIPGSQMIFCHMDRAVENLEVHKELCRQGVFLEYDTIGRPKYHSDEEEGRIFAEMTDSGHEDNLLFSLDTTRARLKEYTEDAVGLDYILRNFMKTLYEYGIGDSLIKKFSESNCIKALINE